MNWSRFAPAVTASFLASLVEFVEALTIVLAVGTVRGWRSALLGVVLGCAFLVALVLGFGSTLQRVPLAALQLVVGVLLLLFGMRWLRKAVLRAAGVVPLHDEDAIYARTRSAIASRASATARVDTLAAVTTFKAVVLEGLEVVFIVIATGAVGHLLVPAAFGAAAAGVLVLLAGLVLHRPLSRVPENGLKFTVGVLLSSFGAFWVGEGLSLSWPGEDLSLLGLVAGFFAAALLGVALAKRLGAQPSSAAEGNLS